MGLSSGNRAKQIIKIKYARAKKLDRTRGSVGDVTSNYQNAFARRRGGWVGGWGAI